MDKNSQRYAWGILAILSIIWGSSFILMKRGLEVFSPDEVGSLRILSAAIFLTPFSIPAIKRINKKNFKWLLSVGMVGSFIPAFLFATAQTQISSALAGILNALTPLFVLLIGVIIFKQSTNRGVIAGLALGFIGCVFLILNGKNGFGDVNYYAFFIVVATICYGFNVNLIKFNLSDLPAVKITSLSLLIVLPIALVYIVGFTPVIMKLQTTPGAWVGLGYISLLGVMGTSIALILFNHLVQITDPVFTSIVTYLIPVVAIIWGLLDGESINVVHIAGFATVLSSVYVINRGKKRI